MFRLCCEQEHYRNNRTTCAPNEDAGTNTTFLPTPQREGISPPCSSVPAVTLSLLNTIGGPASGLLLEASRLKLGHLLSRAFRVPGLSERISRLCLVTSHHAGLDGRR